MNLAVNNIKTKDTALIKTKDTALIKTKDTALINEQVITANQGE